MMSSSIFSSSKVNVTDRQIAVFPVGTYLYPTIPTVDRVPSIRCSTWPPMASTWVSRDRRYSWPSNQLVYELVSEGCDDVPVGHRAVADNRFQWRLSFSRAEVKLIRNWSPIQQIVYHMMRYFMKQELHKGDIIGSESSICTYHVKTLMLWACELKSTVWWQSQCVIDICSKLLNILKMWLFKRCLPHYFVPEWNLFNVSDSKIRNLTESLEQYSDRQNLAIWFQCNYVKDLFKMLQVETVDVNSIKRFCNAGYEWVQTHLITESENNLSIISNYFAAMNHYGHPIWNKKSFYRFLISNNMQSPNKRHLDLACVLRIV